MRYYYHEKERLGDLFKRKKIPKIPITVYLRDRSTIELHPQHIDILKNAIGTDVKKIKTLFTDKKTISNLLNKTVENIKKINNKRNNRRS